MSADSSTDPGASSPTEMEVEGQRVFGFIAVMSETGPEVSKIFGIGKNKISIGRGGKNDIRLNARIFSRLHASLTINEEGGVVKVELKNESHQRNATRVPYELPHGNSVVLDNPSIFLLQGRRFKWIENEEDIDAAVETCPHPVVYLFENQTQAAVINNVVEHSSPKSQQSSSQNTVSSGGSPSPKKRRSSTVNVSLELRKAAHRRNFRSSLQMSKSRASIQSIAEESLNGTDDEENDNDGDGQSKSSLNLMIFSPDPVSAPSTPANPQNMSNTMHNNTDKSLIDFNSPEPSGTQEAAPDDVSRASLAQEQNTRSATPLAFVNSSVEISTPTVTSPQQVFLDSDLPKESEASGVSAANTPARRSARTSVAQAHEQSSRSNTPLARLNSTVEIATPTVASPQGLPDLDRPDEPTVANTSARRSSRASVTQANEERAQSATPRGRLNSTVKMSSPTVASQEVPLDSELPKETEVSRQSRVSVASTSGRRSARISVVLDTTVDAESSRISNKRTSMKTPSRNVANATADDFEEGISAMFKTPKVHEANSSIVSTSTVADETSEGISELFSTPKGHILENSTIRTGSTKKRTSTASSVQAPSPVALGSTTSSSARTSRRNSRVSSQVNSSTVSTSTVQDETFNGVSELFSTPKGRTLENSATRSGSTKRGTSTFMATPSPVNLASTTYSSARSTRNSSRVSTPLGTTVDADSSRISNKRTSMKTPSRNVASATADDFEEGISAMFKTPKVDPKARSSEANNSLNGSVLSNTMNTTSTSSKSEIDKANSSTVSTATLEDETSEGISELFSTPQGHILESSTTRSGSSKKRTSTNSSVQAPSPVNMDLDSSTSSSARTTRHSSRVSTSVNMENDRSISSPINRTLNKTFDATEDASLNKSLASVRDESMEGFAEMFVTPKGRTSQKSLNTSEQTKRNSSRTPLTANEPSSLTASTVSDRSSMTPVRRSSKSVASQNETMNKISRSSGSSQANFSNVSVFGTRRTSSRLSTDASLEVGAGTPASEKLENLFEKKAKSNHSKRASESKTDFSIPHELFSTPPASENLNRTARKLTSTPISCNNVTVDSPNLSKLYGTPDQKSPEWRSPRSQQSLSRDSSTNKQNDLGKNETLTVEESFTSQDSNHSSPASSRRSRRSTKQDQTASIVEDEAEKTSSAEALASPSVMTSNKTTPVSLSASSSSKKTRGGSLNLRKAALKRNFRSSVQSGLSIGVDTNASLEGSEDNARSLSLMEVSSSSSASQTGSVKEPNNTTPKNSVMETSKRSLTPHPRAKKSTLKSAKPLMPVNEDSGSIEEEDIFETSISSKSVTDFMSPPPPYSPIRRSSRVTTTPAQVSQKRVSEVINSSTGTAPAEIESVAGIAELFQTPAASKLVDESSSGQGSSTKPKRIYYRTSSAKKSNRSKLYKSASNSILDITIPEELFQTPLPAATARKLSGIPTRNSTSRSSTANVSSASVEVVKLPEADVVSKNEAMAARVSLPKAVIPEVTSEEKSEEPQAQEEQKEAKQARNARANKVPAKLPAKRTRRGMNKSPSKPEEVTAEAEKEDQIVVPVKTTRAKRGRNVEANEEANENIAPVKAVRGKRLRAAVETQAAVADPEIATVEDVPSSCETAAEADAVSSDANAATSSRGRKGKKMEEQPQKVEITRSRRGKATRHAVSAPTTDATVPDDHDQSEAANKSAEEAQIEPRKNMKRRAAKNNTSKANAVVPKTVRPRRGKMVELAAIPDDVQNGEAEGEQSHAEDTPATPEMIVPKRTRTARKIKSPVADHIGPKTKRGRKMVESKEENNSEDTDTSSSSSTVPNDVSEKNSPIAERSRTRARKGKNVEEEPQPEAEAVQPPVVRARGRRNAKETTIAESTSTETVTAKSATRKRTRNASKSETTSVDEAAPEISVNAEEIMKAPAKIPRTRAARGKKINEVDTEANPGKEESVPKRGRARMDPVSETEEVTSAKPTRMGRRTKQNDVGSAEVKTVTQAAGDKDKKVDLVDAEVPNNDKSMITY